MLRFHRLLVLGVLLLAATPYIASPLIAAEKETVDADEISYYRQIQPIFQTHCQGCHQPAKRGGDYVMTDFAQLVQGGETGETAIARGKPLESNLIAMITPQDGEAEMPRGGKPLGQAERDLIKRWITQGAVDDTPKSAQPQYDMEHPPKYAAAPVITSLDYSADGSLLAVSGYHEVVLHHADGSGIAARLVGLSERIESAIFSPDGKRLAVTGGSPGRMGELQIWDVAKRELLHAKTIGYDTCYGASWSHDGKLIAFGCPDNTVRAVEAETGKQVLFNGAHSDWVLDSVFSLKSDHLVTVSRDRSMKLINVGTQRFIDNITSITPGALKGGLSAVARHPSKDEVLAGGADGVPKLYRMYREKARRIGDDFNLIRAYPGMPGRIFDVDFRPDAKQLIAGSSFNGKGEVRVYNVEDAKQQMRFETPGGVFAVALSPNGEHAAAGGFDGRIRILTVADGKLVREFTAAPIDAGLATGAK